MNESPRDSLWRQGYFLTDEFAASHIDNYEFGRSKVMVISHDCDIQHTSEQYVELIHGVLVSEPDGSFQNAQNPRKIHLEISHNGKPTWLEAHMNSKIRFDRQLLTSTGTPDFQVSLETNSRRALTQWLIARYGRPSFPSNFETRLKKVSRKLENKAAKHSLELHGVYIRFVNNTETELPENEAYKIEIMLVYYPDRGELGAARRRVENLSTEISDLFEAQFAENESNSISLHSCRAMAITALPLSMALEFKHLRLDHLSVMDRDAWMVLDQNS